MAITNLMLHQVYHHSARSTSVTVGVEQGCGVGEAGAVGVVVDGPHPGLISTAVLPWDIDGVADTAIRQPARITLV